MTKPLCPHCGHSIDADDLFCAGCGEEVPPPASLEPTCEHCGGPRDPDDLFCAGCGGELPAIPSRESEGPGAGVSGRSTAPDTSGKSKKSPPKKPPPKKPAPSKAPKDRTAKPKRAPAKKAKGTRAKSADSPNPQPEIGTLAPGTKKISRWWPESSGGRTAYLAILIAAGIFGVAAGEGNPAGAPITAALALALLTFWRNVWISWTGGTTRSVDGPENQSPFPPKASPSLQAKAESIEPSDEEGGGTLEKVIGIAIVLGFLALVRVFAPQILKVLF